MVIDLRNGKKSLPRIIEKLKVITDTLASANAIKMPLKETSIEDLNTIVENLERQVSKIIINDCSDDYLSTLESD